ncbi:OSTB protein, partial [Brachypteracias leptosomus]|nr:OSTB protein [Brachypteracias leptosomus]
MKLFWIIPFFLLQDTEAFLMKNAKVKLCLEASPTSGNLLLEDCDPESHFQDWSWQGHSLVNQGTRSCLTVVGANSVQTSLCGSTSWDCSDSLLSPLGSSQGYLVANRKGVALNDVRGLKAQWQDVAERSVCEEKAEAEQDRHFFAALASTHGYEHTAGNATLALGISQEELEELLWFFRREDPAAWNYSILALSFITLVLGLLLLAINVARNRKRKIHEYREAAQAAQQAELEAKQALMSVQQEQSPAEPEKQEPLPQDQKAGDVVVQWKDGTITSLYTERSEDPV